MKNNYLLPIVIIFLLQLSACSWINFNSKQLLTQAPHTQPRSAQQLWQLDWQQERYLLTVVSEIKQQGWQWVMLNALGQRLATVNRIQSCLCFRIYWQLGNTVFGR
jgi:hypothetical protein